MRGVAAGGIPALEALDPRFRGGDEKGKRESSVWSAPLGHSCRTIDRGLALVRCRGGHGFYKTRVSVARRPASWFQTACLIPLSR